MGDVQFEWVGTRFMTSSNQNQQKSNNMQVQVSVSLTQYM